MTNLVQIPFFEPMNQRRRGFTSETKVERGIRIVHCDKLLEEKLGRNDPYAFVVSANYSNVAASIRAAFDGANRDEYF